MGPAISVRVGPMVAAWQRAAAVVGALLVALACEPAREGTQVPSVSAKPRKDVVRPEPQAHPVERETPPQQPDVDAVKRAAAAAAVAADVRPSAFGRGDVVGEPQPGRRRMPWGTVLYKGVDDKREPYLVDAAVTYFARLPAATLHTDGTLTIDWRTRTNAPRGIVYIGMRIESDPLAPPRFREFASEDLRRASRNHRVAQSLGRALQPRYDVNGAIPRGYGEIVWQVEQFIPEIGNTVLFDGRTAFRLQGDAIVQQPSIVVGPLVHVVDTDSFVVSFETDVPTAAAVAVADRVPKVSREKARRHEVLVEGLSPRTRYAYRVAVSDGREVSVAPARELRTRARSGTVKVAIMSDSRADVGAGLNAYDGTNAGALRPLVTSAYRRGAQAIFFAGDLVNGYVTHPEDYDHQLRTWLKVVEGVGGTIPIYTGVGNHEAIVDHWSDGMALGRTGGVSSEARFAALMVNPKGAPPPEREGAPPYDETVYSLDLGNVHFAMINTNYWVASHPGNERYHGAGNREGFVMDGQLDWLDRDLAAARERGVEHIVVMGHEPAFPAGGHAKDAMWWKGEKADVNAMRERFWKLLASHGVLAYVAGDEHNYSRALIGAETVAGAERSVYSVITGGCGAPYYAQDTPPQYVERVQAFSAEQHYTMWTFRPGKPPRLQTIGLTGGVIDDVELTSS
jgi:hypothetical protein